MGDPKGNVSMRVGNILPEAALFGILGISVAGCAVTSAEPGMGGAAGMGPMVSGAANCGGPPPAAPAMGTAMAPCDIYAAEGGPCVAAHSTVRVLYAAYTGPLYQVKKSDGTVHDIMPLANGFANGADQDTFCGTDLCTISTIYDQSGKGNHLTHSPPGGAKTTEDNEANAKSAGITLSGQKVYGVHIVPGVGYRNNTPCGTTVGDNAETEYMVVAGTLQNNACCFDYGNMETNSHDNGEGTMEAVYFGSCTIWNKGAGDGPWIMGDLENGLWAGDSSPFAGNMPITYPFITGMVKGDAAGKDHWTIKSGNAQSGMLITPFDGHRPSSRYNPMRKEGAVGLGTGGDNSSGATGNWFEGVMTAHYSSDAADDAVQANIVSVYGKP